MSIGARPVLANREHTQCSIKVICMETKCYLCLSSSLGYHQTTPPNIANDRPNWIGNKHKPGPNRSANKWLIDYWTVLKKCQLIVSGLRSAGCFIKMLLLVMLGLMVVAMIMMMLMMVVVLNLDVDWCWWLFQHYHWCHCITTNSTDCNGRLTASDTKQLKQL